MYKVLKMNEISDTVNEILVDYELLNKCENPDAILVRSANMHAYEMPASLQCIARAGAGVNNIPIEKCAEKGIVVFNTPGANANAVKELVICALFLASRKIVEGISWAGTLQGKPDVAKLVESGKSAFGGNELFRKKLGVIGLGAIGVMAANSAVDLGMNVIGHDPYISITNAWNLSSSVKKAVDMAELYSECDYLTLHVPLTSNTKNMINADALAKCKKGVKIINCSRNELVNNADMLAALKDGQVSCYITDFPSEELLNVENVITIPHLGASTYEAEDNCAYMAANELNDYLVNGNITNSVNFPACSQPRYNKFRLCVFHKNVSGIIGKMTDLISGQKINIANMTSKSQGDYAYAIFDLDSELSQEVCEKVNSLDDVVKIRTIK